MKIAISLSHRSAMPCFGRSHMVGAPQINNNSEDAPMRVGHGIVFCIALATAMPAIPAEFKLPKEVTPSLRAACETDVRRLCIGADPTIAKVKSCVFAKFFRLGRRCQVELAAAGLSRTN